MVAQGKKGPAEGNLAAGRPAGEQDAEPICLFHVEPVTASLAHTRFVVLSSNLCNAIVAFRSKRATLTRRGASVAACNRQHAPASADRLRKGLRTAMKIDVESSGVALTNSEVVHHPGCAATSKTGEPAAAKRRANSRAKSMLATLDRTSAAVGEYPCSIVQSTRDRSAPCRCASDKTLTTRAPGVAVSRGNSRALKISPWSSVWAALSAAAPALTDVKSDKPTRRG